MSEPTLPDFQYVESPAPPGLGDLVEGIWFIRSSGTERPAPERILPDGRIEIIFNLADRFRHLRAPDEVETQPERLLVGPTTRQMLIESTGEIDIVGIRISPGGGRALFPDVLPELRDQTSDLAEIESTLPGDLSDRLRDEQSLDARCAIVTEALRKAVRTHRLEQRVLGACKLIQSSGGAILVDDIVRETGTSPRTLERLFLKHTGVGPKLLVRLTRFHRVLRRAEKYGLLQAALDAGYFDQSHFLRDFQAFAGVSPSVFFREDGNLMSEAFRSDNGG
jgi:AraC-like DNA-binding protein